MAGDPVTAYVDAAAARMAADGCEVETENWQGIGAIIGHRSDFRLQWMATKLHLFTVITPLTGVTAPVVEEFTNAAMDYALAHKGQLRGLQVGIAVFPCLVSPSVDPAAAAWAEERQRVRFACMARPVVVDVSRGTVSCFRGSPALGLVYAAHLRRKLDRYFPVPLLEAGRRIDGGLT